MANGKWDLTFLYKGFDDPQLEKDIEKLHALALEGSSPKAKAPTWKN